MTPVAAIAALAGDLKAEGVTRVGVAVSGGGDSMALMVLLAERGREAGVAVAAATVDHGLRPEAAEEAALAARTAAALGLPHAILRRDGRDAPGNLQAAARAARYRLLADWAAASGTRHVCLAHTIEDQAETVLLRLARGSGVDGLSGMAAARSEAGGPVWLRPLLAVSRAGLRAELRARGLAWAEDPSNDDPRFDRVKARALLAAGALPGLDAETLAETAVRMAAARRVLGRAARDAAEALAEVAHGAVAFEAAGFAALPDDTRWRLLAAALCRVAGQAYRPRLAALRTAEAAALAGSARAVHGCLVAGSGGRIRVDREPAAIAGLRGPVPGTWDNRWRIEGPGGADLTVGALGAADLARIPGWRDAGIPRAALVASPAIRQADAVLAAPVLDSALRRASPWSAHCLWSKLDFCTGLVSD